MPAGRRGRGRVDEEAAGFVAVKTERGRFTVLLRPAGVQLDMCPLGIEHADPGGVEPLDPLLQIDPVGGHGLAGVASQEPGDRPLHFLANGVVPCGPFALARDTVPVEVAGHGGSVDAELDGELADGGAGWVGLDEVADVGGGEASLRRV